MKTCSTCKQSKPLTEFFRNRAMKDGYQNVCKICSHGYSMDWQHAHPETVRELGRKNKRAERQRKGEKRTQEEWRQWYERNKKHRQSSRRATRDPRKEKARRLALQAIKDGILIRPTECSRCHRNCKPDGHHPDYDKPLEVEWLCRRCHRLTQNKKEAGYLQPPPLVTTK